MGGGQSRSRISPPSNKIANSELADSSMATSSLSVTNWLTEIQIEEFREAFNAFDKDGGGDIDKVELKELFKSLGRAPSEEELDAMIKVADTDGNGTIDFFEFATMMAHMMVRDDSKEAQQERLKMAFGMFDTDGNGAISLREMTAMMYNLGEACSLEDVKELIDQFDVNGDGVIDYEEFATGIANETLLTTRQP